MSSKPNSFAPLVGLLGATLGVGVIGGIISAHNIPRWYVHLSKPLFTPPDAIFAPVWIIPDSSSSLIDCVARIIAALCFRHVF